MEKHQNINPNSAASAREKARELYEEGMRAWKLDNRARAMTLYAESAELDPDGPGAHALEMTRDIMNFFDPSQLNP